MHGHRKISSALGTFAAGEIIGKELIMWLWDTFILAMPFAPFTPMPEAVATQILAGLAFLAFYLTKEDERALS